MKNNLLLIFYSIIIIIICSTGHVLAQRPLKMGPSSEIEIKTARAALDSNLDNIKAHKKYIYAMGLNNPLLQSQYKKWMKMYPENINIPLTIGTVYFNAEMPQARFYLLRAVVLDPKNGKIWSMLSADAYTRGQNNLSIEYIKKAALADTSNAGYAVAYLASSWDSNPNYQQKVFEFVKRYPTSEQGAQLLYWLAERDTNINDKINHFELLHKLYPPQKFRWSSAGMAELADCYLQTDPEKALSLIDGMGDEKDWKMRKQIAGLLIEINKLEKDQNYKEAVIKANQIELPEYSSINTFIELKKTGLLEKAGEVTMAYDSLIVRFAKLPSDEFYAMLIGLGKEMGKDRAQITKDIETIRLNNAVSAYPFNLGLYTSNSKLSLQSLRGKVVLLTFWFPGCGPCREEFPHFQAAVDKFKSSDIVYIGIDVDPEQDPYVVPLLKNTHYSFIPLRGTREFAAKYYNVQGEPENFLIDKNGKIIFQDFRIDSSNERTLEMMISSLL